MTQSNQLPLPSTSTTGTAIHASDAGIDGSVPGFAKKLLSVGLAVLGGVLLVAQNGINTNLRRHAVPSPVPAACVSFSVGLLAISCISVLHRPRCGPTRLQKAPWYAFTGGILGPTYVVAAIVLSSRLGFAAFQLCAITGQLASSLMCDTVGLLHLERRPPTCWRVLAVLGTIMGASLASSDVDIGEEPWRFFLYCFVTFLTGSIFPVQACVNRAMQDYVLTPFRAVVISFAGGTLILFTLSIVLVASSGAIVEFRLGESWMWTGGLCGATLVTSNVVGVPAIGAAAYVTVFLASQLTTAFLFDIVGAFGFTPMKPTPRRVCGLALTIAAAAAYQLQPQRRTGSAVDTSDASVACDVAGNLSTVMPGVLGSSKYADTAGGLAQPKAESNIEQAS